MGAFCSTPAPSPVLTAVPAGLDFHERALSAQAVPGVISDYQRDLKLLMEGALAAIASTAANGAGAAGQGEAPPPAAAASAEPAVGNWEVQRSVAHVPGLGLAWGYLPGVPVSVLWVRWPELDSWWCRTANRRAAGTRGASPLFGSAHASHPWRNRGYGVHVPFLLRARVLWW